MAIWNLQLLRWMLTTNCLRSPALFPPVDPSCVELEHSGFLAQLLLEEVDLESTSGPTSPVGTRCYTCSLCTQVNPWPGVLML